MTQTPTIPSQLKLHHAQGAKQSYQVLQQPGKPEAYLVHDTASDTPIAFMEGTLPAGTVFEAYASKGGDLGVIHQENGLVYFMLPGASVKGQGFKISMAGETLPASTDAKPAPVAQQTQQAVTTQAMILGAGLGTRILPLTEEYLGVAKPALPWLGENTVIGALVELLAKQGIERIYVNTFYQRKSVQRALNEACAKHRMQWFEIPEARATGTAGGVLHILNNPSQFPSFKVDEPLLVLQGDAVSNADLAQLINLHTKEGAVATIGCQVVCDDDVNKFGIIATTNPANPTCGEVATFLEKPTLQQAGSHRLASTGFYVLSSALYPHLQQWYAARLKEEQEAAKANGLAVPESVKEFDFAKDVFNMCLAAKLKLYAQEVEGFWCDIGNPAQYLETIAMAYRGELNQTLPQDLANYYETAGAFYWPSTKALAEKAGFSLSNGVIVAKKA
jgi:NDP-sugar pyrophosphorylase family protein